MRCPDCACTRFHRHVHLTCTGCGLVIEPEFIVNQRIDQFHLDSYYERPSPLQYTDENGHVLVATERLHPLGTVVGSPDDRKLFAHLDDKGRWFRLQNLQVRTATSHKTDRRKYLKQQIDEIGNLLNLPEQHLIITFQWAVQHIDQITEENDEYFRQALVYQALLNTVRRYGLPVTASDLLTVFKQVNKRFSFNQVQRLLSNYPDLREEPTPSMDYGIYLWRALEIAIRHHDAQNQGNPNYNRDQTYHLLSVVTWHFLSEVKPSATTNLAALTCAAVYSAGKFLNDSFFIGSLPITDSKGRPLNNLWQKERMVHNRIVRKNHEQHFKPLLESYAQNTDFMTRLAAIQRGESL